jgi:hypothetical protein
MLIDIPFEIGSEIYPIHLVTTRRETCPECKGTGGSDWEDEWSSSHWSPCNKCGYPQDKERDKRGYLTFRKDPEWELFPDEVKLIEVSIWSTGQIWLVSNKFNPNHRSITQWNYQFLVKDCFKTAKGAAEEIKRRNKKL